MAHIEQLLKEKVRSFIQKGLHTESEFSHRVSIKTTAGALDPFPSPKLKAKQNLFSLILLKTTVKSIISFEKQQCTLE